MKKAESLITWAASGKVAKVKRMLMKGVDPNEKDEHKRAALHWATQEGHAAIVQLLVAAGADVNASDDGGFTPLSIAAGEGNALIVRELLDAGASAKIRNPSDANGTPLHVASAWNRMEVVKVLVERSDVEINAQDSDGKTALNNALDNNFSELAAYLADHGATA